jgi:hypothetical protein
MIAPRSEFPRRPARLTLAVVAVLLLGGCLGKPKLEDRWTRVDLLDSSPKPYQLLAAGATVPITMQTRLTYRAILTGYAVGELRASSSLTPAEVNLNPDAPRLPMAQDIDRILQQSVSLGRATRAVTGWDHLIQPIDFAFDATVPAVLDSSGGPPTGLFLLCYLGSGVKIEIPGQPDSIAITPFNSGVAQVLPVGMELGVAAPGSR